ncbi:ROK family transcriptional regulator [Nisaea acidiphila]|uniref:ROK family transcriptional regulator n=1 Tax=Nisaea acidiphila TaxID=1862145 RepID=A0A9J7ARD8_9PROT|nr:ROK family transcriptional regulator [Nisaea acidiphila]UUX49936.1 ROK family transcriptional regulator [Nisaea acidiphila]
MNQHDQRLGRHIPDPVRAQNRKAIVDCLRRRGAAARIELSEQIGISPATVTIITSELLEDGVIREEPAAPDRNEAARGRPRTRLELNPDAGYAVGIKISMHQAAVSLTDLSGDILGAETIPVRANRDAPEWIADICVQQVQKIIADSAIDPALVLGVGIGIPGYVEYPSGLVRWAPVFSERDVPFKEIVEQRSGFRTFIDNDANMTALAEKWFGVGRTFPTVLVVTVEHGVGMGLVVNEKLYRGAHGFGAEFGHTKIVVGGALCRCGQRGCIEAYASDYAIAREANILGPSVDTDDPIALQNRMRQLIRQADDGDEAVISIFERAGTMLGTGIANLVDILDPPVVVLSGARAQSARAFFSSLRDAMEANSLLGADQTVDLRIDSGGDEVWARGAAALVLEETLI